MLIPNKYEMQKIIHFIYYSLLKLSIAINTYVGLFAYVREANFIFSIFLKANGWIFVKVVQMCCKNAALLSTDFAEHSE